MFHRVHTAHPFIRKTARPNSLTKGFEALGIHTLIREFASSILGIFFPVFLYQLGGSIRFVLFFAIAYYALVFLLEPIGVRVMTHVGLKWAMTIGMGSYVCLYFLLAMHALFPLWMVFVLSVGLYVLAHTTYWVPYHTEFAETAPRRNLGAAISILGVGTALLGVLAPAAAGALITWAGFPALLAATGVVLLISLIPVSSLSVLRERYKYGFFETFHILFARRHRTLLFVYVAEGVESFVSMWIWPLFLFLLLRGNFIQVGVLAAGILAMCVFLRMTVGHAIDRHKGHGLFHLGTGLYSVGWMMKAFVATASQVFLVGTYHGFASIMMRTPFDAIMYSRAADAGHYVDEYTALREMALVVGRVIAGVALLLSLQWVGFSVAFAFAAIASIGLGFASEITSKLQPAKERG